MIVYYAIYQFMQPYRAKLNTRGTCTGNTKVQQIFNHTLQLYAILSQYARNIPLFFSKFPNYFIGQQFAALYRVPDAFLCKP